jgi:hypothetical protein
MTSPPSEARCCGLPPFPSRTGLLGASCILCSHSPTYWRLGRTEVDPYAALRDEPAVVETAVVVELPAAPAGDSWAVDGGLFDGSEAA